MSLAAAVLVGAYFRPHPQRPSALVCAIQTASPSAGGVLAHATLPLTVLPTRWPLWDDAIVVSASAAMRSVRLGVSLNATAALLAAAGAGRAVNDSALATANLTPSLAEALLSPVVVVAAARALWGSEALNYSGLLSDVADATGSSRAFTLTLSGASRVVLFAGIAGLGAFMPLAASNATLGGAACNVSAVSDDGAWAVLDTPSPARLCGPDAGDCGYVALALTTTSGSGALGVSLTCPPFCPGAVGGGVVPLASGGDSFVLGTEPPAALGSLPSPLPPTDLEASSEGIYYAAACSRTGLYTDPATGACSNASDPASRLCAWGSGESCAACPGDALCPGGSRLWPRVGFWAPSEAATSVAPCAPPDPEVKCGGWNVSQGAVRCGQPYQAGSPLCGACARGYYLPGDGSCAACPIVAGLWSRYRTVILLLCLTLGVALAVGLMLVALVACYGGTLGGSARLLLDLAQWSVAALQTVAQAAPVSAAALPPFLATIFRGIAVLQLDGVLLPPACTGAYAFESQVRLRGGGGC